MTTFAGAETDVVRASEFLKPLPNAHEFEHIGNDRDGGYVIVSDLGPPATVVSIGVGHECSADETLAERGAQVFQFDHTVDASPSDNPNVSFVKQGIGTASNGPTVRLEVLLESASVPGDRPSWLLIDVEGAEWDLLHDESAPVEIFDQIVMEIHLLSLLSDPSSSPAIVAGLENLRRRFTPVAWHPNNFGPVHIIGRRLVPDVLEVTFVRSDLFRSGDGYPPPELFRPNDENRPEHPEPFTSAHRSVLGDLPECFTAVTERSQGPGDQRQVDVG